MQPIRATFACLLTAYNTGQIFVGDAVLRVSLAHALRARIPPETGLSLQKLTSPSRNQSLPPETDVSLQKQSFPSRIRNLPPETRVSINGASPSRNRRSLPPESGGVSLCRGVSLCGGVSHLACGWQVNDVSIEAFSHDDAVSALKNAGELVVLVVKYFQSASLFLAKGQRRGRYHGRI